MSTITITCLYGSGANEIGMKVAQSLQYYYVDRQILSEAADQLGSTLEEITEISERPINISERLTGFFRNILERSALSGSAVAPYFGGGMDMLLVREYRDFSNLESADGKDARLLNILSNVINRVADAGNSVIIGRGANMLLSGRPDAFHIGLIASYEDRLKRIMARERIEIAADAEKYIAENDVARASFFQRFFGVDPTDPQQYHMVLNCTALGESNIVHQICDLSKMSTKPD